MKDKCLASKKHKLNDTIHCFSKSKVTTLNFEIVVLVLCSFSREVDNSTKIDAININLAATLSL
jgi:hypothetical protein